MTLRRGLFLLLAGALLGGATYLPLRLYASSEPITRHAVPRAKSGGGVVQLCDGKTTAEIPNLKPGQKMSSGQARAVSNELMAKWREQHPGADWQMAANEAYAQPTGESSGQQGQAGAPVAAATPTIQ